MIPTPAPAWGPLSRGTLTTKLRALGVCLVVVSTCFAGACSRATSPDTGHSQASQVIHEWSHSAAIGDASGAVPVGDTLMFVNINEDDVLRLYSRYPGSACTAPIYSLDVKSDLKTSSGDPADLESAVKMTEGSDLRIYWLGSMSNSSSGNLHPNRDRIFATRVDGDGTGSPPYSLTYVGRYNHLREDLIAWDSGNLHGLGADYFGLAASAAAGVSPKGANGFNVEGLTVAPDGTTAYIGFRAPLVAGSGPTTSASRRDHALIVPLLNMPALVTGSPTPGPGVARFGTPIVLDLGGRGIRSIDYTYPGQYLITAGPTDAVSNPPVGPLDFRLFTWSGDPLVAPLGRATSFAATYTPEACLLPNSPIVDTTVAQFLSDDGAATCFRSITFRVGAVGN